MFIGGGYCDKDKETDVLYISLNNWIEDTESGCPDERRRLVDLYVWGEEGSGDGIKPRDQAGWSQRQRLNSQ